MSVRVTTPPAAMNRLTSSPTKSAPRARAGLSTAAASDIRIVLSEPTATFRPDAKAAVMHTVPFLSGLHRDMSFGSEEVTTNLDPSKSQKKHADLHAGSFPTGKSITLPEASDILLETTLEPARPPRPISLIGTGLASVAPNSSSMTLLPAPLVLGVALALFLALLPRDFFSLGLTGYARRVGLRNPIIESSTVIVIQDSLEVLTLLIKAIALPAGVRKTESRANACNSCLDMLMHGAGLSTSLLLLAAIALRCSYSRKLWRMRTLIEAFQVRWAIRRLGGTQCRTISRSSVNG